jgi:uncharacterized membrane protein
MFSYLLQNVFRGTLVILPLLIIFLLIQMIGGFFERLLPQLSVWQAFVVGTLALASVGWIAHQTFIRVVSRYIFKRIPLFKSVMLVIQAIPFLKEKTYQNAPVWVHTGEGQRKVGFLVHESLPQFDLPDFCTVLVPTSFSLQSECIIVDKKHIEKIHADSDALFFFAVTGGIIDQTSHTKE